jgi:hypothetical protein
MAIDYKGFLNGVWGLNFKFYRRFFLNQTRISEKI